MQGDTVQICRVYQGFNLLAHGLRQLWVRMPQGIDRDTGYAIQIAPTGFVPKPNALAPDKGNRKAGVGVHQMCHSRNNFQFIKMHTAAKAAVHVRGKTDFILKQQEHHDA